MSSKCDLCRKEEWPLTELRAKYITHGVREICQECEKELNDLTYKSHSRALFVAMKIHARTVARLIRWMRRNKRKHRATKEPQ